MARMRFAITLLVAVALVIRMPGAVATARPLLPGATRQQGVMWVGDSAPWFCHDLECPKYTVAETYEGGTIELRAYEESIWASTNISDMSYDAAVRTGFFRLFKYISGNNAEQSKIEMTAPVKVRAVAGEGPFCESHFVVSFMVPFGLQDSPPEPVAEDVYIEKAAASKYYVTSYTGWTDEDKLVKRASALLEDLDGLALKYDNTYFYSAGYDSPFRLVNRHNEVWVPAVDPAH